VLLSRERHSEAVVLGRVSVLLWQKLDSIEVVVLRHAEVLLSEPGIDCTVLAQQS